MSRRHIARTSVVLMFITALAAATGYLREFVLARTFGTGPAMDAFYFALALIQGTHDLLFGATLTATIVPLLHRPQTGESGKAYDPARFTVTIALTVTFLACVVAVLLRALLPYLLDFLAPEMSGLVRTQCLALSTLLVWLVPLNALITIGVLVLNAHHRFVLAATVYVFINVIFAGVVVFLSSSWGFYSLAIGSLAGPACFIPILAAALARMGLLRFLRPDFSKDFFQPIWRQARPILLSFGIGSSLGLLMMAHLIVRVFAANSGQGSIAALGYAFRLYEVPLSLLANPAAVLILPNIAMLYRAGRIADIGEISRQTLLAGLVVLFPAAVVTWVGADLVVHVFLQRGNFGPAAAHITAEALRGFAPAILGEGMIVVFYRVFYAVHRPSRPVSISFAALSGLLCLLFLFGHITFINIPLSLSGGFLIGAIALTFIMRRELGSRALPSLASIAKWGVCALLGVSSLGFATHYESQNVWSELVGIVVFALCYCVAILTAFGDYRKILLNLFGAFARRLREQLSTG